MAKLGILTIHGMGMQLADYANDLISGLTPLLKPDLSHNVAFETIHYHGLSHLEQEKLWERMDRNGLNWDGLRKLFLFAFADATAHHVRPELDSSLYRRVSKEIRNSINALQHRLDDADTPVVIIAQSLGCQVISNYIWDAQRGKGIWESETPSSFEKLENTKLMITTGCNIPLFVAGLEKIEAIAPPNESFEWFNYYDKDDILGWPLKPLSQGFENAYDKVVTEDIPIDSGKLPNNFTPFSHLGYWRDKDFLDSIAKKINQLYSNPI